MRPPPVAATRLTVRLRWRIDACASRLTGYRDVADSIVRSE
jgi:hypothetical protein